MRTGDAVRSLPLVLGTLLLALTPTASAQGGGGGGGHTEKATANLSYPAAFSDATVTLNGTPGEATLVGDLGVTLVLRLRAAGGRVPEHVVRPRGRHGADLRRVRAALRRHARRAHLLAAGDRGRVAGRVGAARHTAVARQLPRLGRQPGVGFVDQPLDDPRGDDAVRHAARSGPVHNRPARRSVPARLPDVARLRQGHRRAVGRARHQRRAAPAVRL
jgi:hypothetical protein